MSELTQEFTDQLYAELPSKCEICSYRKCHQPQWDSCSLRDTQKRM